MYADLPAAFLNSMGSPMEMAVVFIAILVLFGAKSLPQTLRTLGRVMEQMRQISQDVKRQVMEAGEPLEEAKKAWERESREFTVSSGPVRPTPELPPAAPDAPDDNKTESGESAT
jgi:Sec-independent protein translocase protein TatA